jgi:hypothetical protein
MMMKRLGILSALVWLLCATAVDAQTLTATPATITGGQATTLLLSLPTVNYHNIFINGVRPACGVVGAAMTCTLTVIAVTTVTYQASATNSAGVPYMMPKVTVTVQASPLPAPPVNVDVTLAPGLNLNLTRRADNVSVQVDMTVNKDAVVKSNGLIVPPPVPIPTPGTATLTATPPSIASGQSSLLELLLPNTNYHNIAINGVPPVCSTFGTGYSCILTARPAGTTVYQATAVNSLGVPYVIPSVPVTVTGTPAPPLPAPVPVPPPSTGTIQVPPGQPIPVRQWVERPMPQAGQAFMGGGGGKHGRAFYHAGLKGLVFAGGDWRSSMSFQLGLDGNGEGSEIWTLNAVTDTWTMLRKLCIPSTAQPGRPDSVNWAYDSLRNRGLMAPGFYFITQGGPYPNGPSNCGAVEGFGGYAFSFATKDFTGPDVLAGFPVPPSGWGGDDGAAFALYDPIMDEFVRVRNGPRLERLNLATKIWRVQSLQLTPTWNPVPNRSQSVIDVQGRAVYFLDAWSARALIKISLTDGTTTAIPLPAPYVLPFDSSNEVYLVFDPVNRMILVPNNRGMGAQPLEGLGVYAVDAGIWTWEAVPTAVWGSVWGFDENTGALLGIGKRQSPTSYYLWKVK